MAEVGDWVRWDCTDGPICGEVTAFIEYDMFGETWTRMEIELSDGTLRTMGLKNSDYYVGKVI